MADAGVSLPQLVADRGVWIMLRARLLRIVSVSYALLIFYEIDILLSNLFLGDIREATAIVDFAFTLIAWAVFCLLTLNVYAIASHAAASLVGERELSTLTLATSFSWAVHLLSMVITLLYIILFFISSLICLLLGFYLFATRVYALAIVTCAMLVIQIVVLVSYIRGGEEVVVFLFGKQYLPDGIESTVVPLQDTSPMEEGGGIPDGRGGVSVSSLLTTSTVTVPVNVLLSMRSALSGIAASFGTPSASAADGAYSALSAEDSVHDLHTSMIVVTGEPAFFPATMVVVTGVPIFFSVAGQHEGSTNII